MSQEEVNLYRDCGMNFVMTPPIDMNNEFHVTKAREMLDYATNAGVKVLVNVRALIYPCFKDGVKYREDLGRALDLFGRHPAAIGFFLGDEPGSGQMEKCKELYKIFCEMAPDLLPYLNLNPGQFKDGGDFAENGGCRMLSYDCYSQMNPDKEGVDHFFRNLNSYYTMAKAADIPLMSIVLGTGHFRYRVPSEDDLRWQFGACVACGSSALLWFTFHTPNHINYRGGAIDAFGSKTPTYDAMRRVHLQFKRDYADLINHTRLEEAFWVGKPVCGLEPFQPGEPSNLADAGKVLNVCGLGGTPLIVSFLRGKGKQEGRSFVLVFNNTVNESEKVRLSAKKDVKHVWMCRGERWLDWEGYHPDANFYRNERGAHAEFWLAPGQFEVFCLE